MTLGAGSPLQSPGPLVCPFPMPAQYEEAKESKVQTVAALRNSIKSVSVPTFTLLVDCLAFTNFQLVLHSVQPVANMFNSLATKPLLLCNRCYVQL